MGFFIGITSIEKTGRNGSIVFTLLPSFGLWILILNPFVTGNDISTLIGSEGCPTQVG